MAVRAPPDLAAFGSFTPVRPLPGGHRNSVWLVQGPEGLYVAKSTRRSAPALKWLAPLEAAARAAGLIVPPAIMAQGVRPALGWTLEGFIEGKLATSSDMAALAPRIAAFRRAIPELPQRPGFCSLPQLLQTDRGGDIDLSALPAALRAACRAAWQPFAAAPTRPIHGDLTAGNVIMSPAGPVLLDWDEARVDLPFLDAISLRPLTPDEARAHLASEIASGWHLEPDHARALIRQLVCNAATPRKS